MRRRRLTIVLLGITAILAVPALSGAAPIPGTIITSTGFFRFCAEGQIGIANIDTSKLVENGGDFTITGTVYKDESDFVFSKSAVVTSAKKISTTAYVQYENNDLTKPKLIRCKMRTGERATGPTERRTATVGSLLNQHGDLVAPVTDSVRRLPPTAPAKRSTKTPLTVCGDRSPTRKRTPLRTTPPRPICPAPVPTPW